jgi:fatty acid desaturase
MSQKRSKSLLRYDSDTRSLAATASLLVLTLAPFFFDAPAWAWAPYLPILLFLRGLSASIHHNHAHLSVFHSSALNAALDIVLGQLTGVITPEWELHHNRGHHRDFLDPSKDVHSLRDPVTGKQLSRGWYSLRGALLCGRDSLRIARQELERGGRNLIPRFWIHRAIQLAVIAALACVSPWKALVFVALPAAWVRVLIGWVAFGQHAGTPGTDVYDSSTIRGNAFSNFLTFNAGHHVPHHEKPTLHWTLLPARTRAIAHLIPDVCFPGGRPAWAAKYAAKKAKAS